MSQVPQLPILPAATTLYLKLRVLDTVRVDSVP